MSNHPHRRRSAHRTHTSGPPPFDFAGAQRARLESGRDESACDFGPMSHTCGCVVWWGIPAALSTLERESAVALVERLATYPCPWHGGDNPEYPPPDSDPAVFDVGYFTLAATRRPGETIATSPRPADL